MRVLIVEDNDVDRESITRFLGNVGIECTCASSLGEAYLLDPKPDVDLILLDGNLSDSDANRTAEFAKHIAVTPVIIVTGDRSKFDKHNENSTGKKLTVLDKTEVSERLLEAIEKVRSDNLIGSK